MIPRAFPLLLGAAMAACGAPRPDAAMCAEAPVVTYDNFGRGFLNAYCQGCHASTATSRGGAPDDVTFDTRAEVHTLAPRILARAAGASPTMPPAGGVLEEEREALEIWLRCYPDELPRAR